MKAHSLADLVPVWVAAPMQYEPGSQWKYTQSGINAAARIVEVVSGMSYDQFLAQRLFAPLGKRVITLDDAGCLCTTMYRISPQHLAWALENLVEGRVVNRIKVEEDVKQWARVALDRMLEI